MPSLSTNQRSVILPFIDKAGKQHSTQDDHKTFIIGKHTFQNHLQAKTSEYRVTLLTLLSKAH